MKDAANFLFDVELKDESSRRVTMVAIGVPFDFRELPPCNRLANKDFLEGSADKPYVVIPLRRGQVAVVGKKEPRCYNPPTEAKIIPNLLRRCRIINARVDSFGLSLDCQVWAFVVSAEMTSRRLAKLLEA